MADQASSNGNQIVEDTSSATAPAFADKGKGKAPQEHPTYDAMDEDESEESDNEGADEDDDSEDDAMEEVDLDNIVPGGRRTRGKVIDFAKAAEEAKGAGELDDDEDEDDDDDFEQPDEEMEG